METLSMGRPKLFNSSEKIANIIINAWRDTCGDEKVKEEKTKHYYDALTIYMCSVIQTDIDQTWIKILNSLKKDEFRQVKQLIAELMTCRLPPAVREALENNDSYDRNDDRVSLELTIKESDVMFKSALQFDGEICLVVDRAVKLDKNILKLEVSSWSVIIGEGDECKTNLASFPPDVKTSWVEMIESTYLYLIKEKRLIEI